jgi:hypothetical protein
MGILAGCAVALVTFSMLHSGATAATPKGEYRGSGGLVLPIDSSQRMREFAVNCAGCSWRFSSPCALRLVGNLQQCEVRDSSCSQGQLLRIWVLEPDDYWKERGVACFSRGGPVFVRAIQIQAEQALVDALPRLSINCTPRSGVVTQLPLRCDSSLRQEVPPVYTKLHGIPIRLELKPHWRWSVDESSGVGQIHPGGSTRAPSWHHVFAHRGRFEVSHRVTWVATMHLEGLAHGIRVPDVVQRANSHIWVGSLAPVLVASRRYPT